MKIGNQKVFSVILLVGLATIVYMLIKSNGNNENDELVETMSIYVIEKNPNKVSEIPIKFHKEDKITNTVWIECNIKDKGNAYYKATEGSSFSLDENPDLTNKPIDINLCLLKNEDDKIIVGTTFGLSLEVIK